MRVVGWSRRAEPVREARGCDGKPEHPSREGGLPKLPAEFCQSFKPNDRFAPRGDVPIDERALRICERLGELQKGEGFVRTTTAGGPAERCL
jgi:hypothetical protein